VRLRSSAVVQLRSNSQWFLVRSSSYKL